MTDRVLVPGLSQAVPSGEVTVTGNAGHHLARVTRVRPGDRVVLFDGAGHECDGAVTDSHGDTVRLSVGPLRAGVGADRGQVTWLQGIPKGDKLETIVRQATELGVSAVWPVFTLRSVPQPRGAREGTRTERLRRVAEEAARQCGRADLPDVADARTLDEALDALAGTPTVLRLVAWEEATRPLTSALAGPLGPCAVLAGPEGGLGRDEVGRAMDRGFIAVSLGPRILRTETVAPALLGALAVLRGDLTAR